MKSGIKSGDTFGLWTVIEMSKDRRWHASCKCKCGTVRDVIKSALKNGASQSCGCVAAKKLSKSAFKHGLADRDDPVYNAWCSMKARCLNKKHPQFYLYGGRGISVCDKWQRDFVAFKRDMGPRPDGATIERKNTNGDYTKGNCRWETHKINCQNTRASKFWTVEKARFNSLTEASAACGVAQATIKGWCEGYERNGRAYPAKAGCFSERKYP